MMAIGGGETRRAKPTSAMPKALHSRSPILWGAFPNASPTAPLIDFGERTMPID